MYINFLDKDGEGVAYLYPNSSDRICTYNVIAMIAVICFLLIV